MNLRYLALMTCSLCCLSGAVLAQAPKPVKNLIENGDFSAGASRWQGHGRVEVFTASISPAVPPPQALAGSPNPPAPPAPKLPPLPFATPAGRSSLTPTGMLGAKTDVNRVWAVSLSSKAQLFSQRFDVPRNAKLLRVSYKTFPSADLKTERTTLGAIQVRVQPLNAGYTFYDRQIPPEQQWVTTTFVYTIKEPSRFFDLAFEVEPGEGQISFDDVVVEALEH